MGKLLEETQLSMSKFKVGDKVVVKGFESNGEDEVIAAFFTYDGDLKYRTKNHQYCHYFTEDRLKLIEKIEKNMEEPKEETMEEKENLVVVNNEHKQLKVHSLRHDKVQLMIDDKYELKQEGNAYYIVKRQQKYPKTYEECCKHLMGKTNFQDFELVLTKLSTSTSYEHTISPAPPHIKLINDFYKLLICRDAYWKLAGDWKPDWCDENKLKYCIECSFGTIDKTRSIVNGCLLAFPTEEMRDTFYENFKEEIEKCKEIL